MLIGLPTAFAGGDLRVSHDGEEIIIDWSDAEKKFKKTSTLPWVFFFSDVEHEVYPVKSGVRLTIAYDVYHAGQGGLQKSATKLLDVTKLPFYLDLKEKLNDPEFLPKGGKVAIGLKYKYPLKEYSAQSDKDVACFLKGEDAILHRVVLALDIPLSFKLAYQDDNANTYTSEMEYQLITNVDFRWEDEPEETFYTGWVGAKEDSDLMCKSRLITANVGVLTIFLGIREASASTEAGAYCSYGNEATLDVYYGSVAFVLDIPACGMGCRKQNGDPFDEEPGRAVKRRKE